jgi:hypothetical protein
MARTLSRARTCRTLALAAGIGALWLAVAPASAQFGSIFGQPPRPPSDVPGGPPPRLQPPGPPRALPAPPPEDDEDAGDIYEQRPPQRYERPGPMSAPTSTPRSAPLRTPMPGAVQSQPLAPPPGAAVEPAPPPAAGTPTVVVPPAAMPGVAPPSASAPVVAAPAGPGSPRNAPQPTSTAPQPGDEVITEMPSQKIANPKAVFSGLDKITGRITSFDAAINETVQFGALQVTPRVCYTRPPTETPNTDAFIEVDEVTLQAEVKRIFTGWTFASSPGLRGVEHPIYDIWLTDCKGGTPPVAAAAPAAPPPRASQQRTSQPQGRSQQPARAPQAQPQRQPTLVQPGVAPASVR